MKKTDIALIILIAVISVLLSYWVSNMIFGNPNEKYENLKYMDPISSNLSEPDIETFNTLAIDPVVEVMIGTCNTGTVWSDKDQKCVKAEDSGNKEDGGSDSNEVVDGGSEGEQTEGSEEYSEE